MRFVRFRGETSIGAIADEVYADLSSASRKRAVTALLRANPQLATLESVRPGAILVIPEIAGTRLGAGSKADSPQDESADYLIQALNDYGKKLSNRHEEFESDVKAQQGVWKNRTVSRAVSKSREASKLMERITKSLSDRSKAAKDNFKRLEAAIKGLTTDLAER